MTFQLKIAKKSSVIFYQICECELIPWLFLRGKKDYYYLEICCKPFYCQLTCENLKLYHI